jgi:two-component system, chemotaxis family, response regulator Rcp1
LKTGSTSPAELNAVPLSYGFDAASRVANHIVRFRPRKKNFVTNDERPDRKPVDILLVEDNPGDLRLMLEMLKEGKVRNRIAGAADGVEAHDFLTRRGPQVSAFRPDLVLLDLNLPRMDGRDVLAEIRDHAELSRIPVVVFTSSAEDEDVLRSYDLRAACYVTKPLDVEQFMRIVQQVKSIWFTLMTAAGEVG